MGSVLHHLRLGTWLTWEAVLCTEQGLPLSEAQRGALGELMSFGDDDERILYINDWARPTEPWYESVHAERRRHSSRIGGLNNQVIRDRGLSRAGSTPAALVPP